MDCVVPGTSGTGPVLVPIGRSNSANSTHSANSENSVAVLHNSENRVAVLKFVSLFLKFRCPIGPKSTLTRFAPLRALTPFEVYIGLYLVGLNVRGSRCGHIICISSRSY